MYQQKVKIPRKGAKAKSIIGETFPEEKQMIQPFDSRKKKEGKNNGNEEMWISGNQWNTWNNNTISKQEEEEEVEIPKKVVSRWGEGRL